ncbi:MAG: hypothetical protein ACE5HN_04280 [Nitrospiria bacterium]
MTQLGPGLHGPHRRRDLRRYWRTLSLPIYPKMTDQDVARVMGGGERGC